MDSAYPYQPAGTIGLTVLTDQSQSSTLILPYPLVEMETSLGLTPSGQTLCLLQSPDLCKAEDTHDAQRKTPPVDGDRSLTALIHSPSEFLALPPAPSLEQTEVNSVHEMTEEAEVGANAGAREGAIDNLDSKHLQDKTQKSAPTRPRLAGEQGQDKTKRTRGNNFTKTQELRPSSHRVKTQEKPTVPNTKRKRNPPELSHDSLKKPGTHLSMHMLESVQVFHPLGKKSEYKTGISSTRALLNFSHNKYSSTDPATTSLQDVPCEGRGPGKTLGNAQCPQSRVCKEYPSLAQYELPLPGKECSQVVYYDHKSLGPLMAGELGQCLQAYGSVSYPGSQASTLQLEMVVVLKDIQPMNVQKPFSTSATPAQDIPDTSLQVVEMVTSLSLTPSGQTLCLLQSPDLCNAYIHDAQMKTPPVDGERTLTALIHSPSEFLALPPAPSLEQIEVNNVHEMSGEQSTPQNAYEGTKGNQGASLLPLAHPDMQQPLMYTDAGSLRQKPANHNAILASNSLGLEEPGALQSVMVSGIDLEDMTTLVSDIQLPQLLNSLTDLENGNITLQFNPMRLMQQLQGYTMEVLQQKPDLIDFMVEYFTCLQRPAPRIQTRSSPPLGPFTQESSVVTLVEEVSGKVRILIRSKTKMNKNGGNQDVEIAHCHKEQYFGELALVTNKPRAASAYVVGDVKCLVMDVQALQRFLGPRMDIMKRNISHYEQQLVKMFGSDIDLLDPGQKM
ncbi:hypothetical protein A6R68_03547 [Neotoma lepida]|uniref:Cyclic nucleotide-binding domain-containing protein n=1 Tax=Neotoma lepida TaxID=56216 RepID=A0A1A6GNP8_NEOLE|nr:hypothetical protein A6R68_03547 [Neotoma lepida]